jgi:hypothetical protein
LTQERVSKYMGTRRRRRRSAWDTILGVGKIFAGAVDVEVGEGQQVGGAEGHLDGKATARDARGSGGVREVGDVAPHVKKNATWASPHSGKGGGTQENATSLTEDIVSPESEEVNGDGEEGIGGRSPDGSRRPWYLGARVC